MREESVTKFFFFFFFFFFFCGAQTTIIWDAHTGEAKQQFPFHSGEYFFNTFFFFLTFLVFNSKIRIRSPENGLLK